MTCSDMFFFQKLFLKPSLGLIAGSIWWNHLLGGARRWAILSGQLASQLVDQADAAAGIAFLTRDWAEMARRSLVALDQDARFCLFCCSFHKRAVLDLC